MTREEAIDRLRKISEKTPIRTNGDDLVAITMAIQALSQEPQCTEHPCLGTLCRYYKEPCTDAVSREAVCEIINDIRDCISVEGYCAILERLKKLPSVNPQPCDDAISREYLKKIAQSEGAYGYVSAYDIATAPSVTPKPKTGHWILTKDGFECTECGCISRSRADFCQYCGARIMESEQNE